jgi:hypothetical protein
MRVARILHDPICGCECEVCDSDEINGTYRAQSFTYSGITSLWHACVCPKPNGVEFHRQEYLLGDCSMYGVENMLPLCPTEEFGGGNHVVDSVWKGSNWNTSWMWGAKIEDPGGAQGNNIIRVHILLETKPPEICEA